jgi:hypothetical protein
MKYNKKRLAVIIAAALVFTASIVSAVDADSVGEKIQAYLGVRIQYNGKELISEKQPYIKDDTTYVPLRLLMDNFDKAISYDTELKKVIIKDRESSAETELYSKIAAMESQITKLHNENIALKSANETLVAENKELTSKNASLSNRIYALEYVDAELTDIVDELFYDYENAGETYLGDEEILFSITLDGDADEVEFEVYLDFSNSDDNDDMEDISITYIKKLMKAIYNDLADALEDSDHFEDAGINGIIIDDSDNVVEYDGKSFDPTSW